MQKINLCIAALFLWFNVFSQTDTLSKTDKAALDSMMKNDEFLKMLNEKEKNSVDISIGISNGAFSSYNQAANATGVSNQVILNPSVMYRLKSGLSFGVTGYLTNDASGKMELYQTGLSAGYDYYGDEVNTGITYTHFLSDKHKYNSKSLYQHDFYGYLKKAHGAIQPGLSVGYSQGNSKEATFTQFLLRRPLNPRGDTLIKGIDSADNKASYFSASAIVEHNFNFTNVFDAKDEFAFTPALMINFGSDKLTQVHTNKIFNRPALSSRKKVQATNKFELQSLGLSLDAAYGIGKFFLQTNLYFDYYIPETTSKRLTSIYSISFGVSL
jgi:hypothetical protein